MSLKSRVADVIVEAELKSVDAGIGVGSLISKYADEIKSDDPKVSRKLREIAYNIERGRKKWSVYKNYLSEDVLQLIKIAEEKSMPSSEIFKEYAPVKTMAETQMRSIRRSLIFPSVVIAAATLGMGGIISKMREIASAGVRPSDTAMFVMNHFYEINVAFLAVFFISLFFFPQKMPVLGKLFSILNGIISLSIVKIMYVLSIPSGEILQALIRYHGKKRGMPKFSADVEGLVKYLKYMGFVTPVEAANMKIDADFSDFTNAAKKTLEKKMNDAKDMREMGMEAVKNLTLLAMSVPVISMLTVIIGIMTAVMELVGKAG